MSHFDEVDLPLLDASDLDILMHKEVHFGGSFPLMMEYYEQEGVGVMPEFSLKRIKQLMQEEEKKRQNLAQMCLPSSALSMIEDAKHLYMHLRSIYEYPTSPPLSLAMADLILSEEDPPREEMRALCQHGSAAVGPLIDLIQTDKFYHPLYPGYGRAPILAAECLAKIHDEQAIPALFEAIGHENFFADDAMISALRSFGASAVSFLLKRVSQKPFGKENEHAAIALSSFPEEHRIALCCLSLLQDPDLKKQLTLANYLILGCAALKTPEEKKLFLSLRDEFPGVIKHEMDLIAKNWKLI